MGIDAQRKKADKREAREARNREEKLNRKAERKKKVKPKWRRLNDGGVAFGDKFKIGRGGLISFAVITSIGFACLIGLTLYPINPEGEGGVCANPFCHWVNTLTGSDMAINDNFNEQTPKFIADEDKDFLPPPQNFLLPLAEARGEDEPTCYSKACEKNHKESKEHFDSEDAQAKSINEKIVDMKVKIEKTKDVIDIIEEKIRDYKLSIPLDELDLVLLEKEVEDQQDLVKELRYEWDRMRYNYADKEELEEFEKGYKDERQKLKDLEYKYDKLENDILRDNELLDKEEEYLEMAEIDLLMFMDDLTKMKIDLHKIHRAGNLFAIRLSETCNTMIREGMNEYEVAKIDENNWAYDKEIKQKCPTYRQLADMYDNTLEPISGEFEDLGYDIRRGESGYKDYWRYYYNLPNWKVITVDPDVDMLQRAMVIEIQASDFRYAADDKQHQLNIGRFDNGTMSERGYVYYENVSIDKECRHANIAPDIELVGKVLQHFMNECNEQLDYHYENRITLPYISFDKMDSSHYEYIRWLNNAIKSVNELQIGK